MSELPSMSETLNTSQRFRLQPISNTTSNHQGIHELLAAFWQTQISDIENDLCDFKFHQLPLARIKKVMKADEDVKVRVFYPFFFL